MTAVPNLSCAQQSHSLDRQSTRRPWALFVALLVVLQALPALSASSSSSSTSSSAVSSTSTSPTAPTTAPAEPAWMTVAAVRDLFSTASFGAFDAAATALQEAIDATSSAGTDPKAKRDIEQTLQFWAETGSGASPSAVESTGHQNGTGSRRSRPMRVKAYLVDTPALYLCTYDGQIVLAREQLHRARCTAGDVMTEAMYQTILQDTIPVVEQWLSSALRVFDANETVAATDGTKEAPSASVGQGSRRSRGVRYVDRSLGRCGTIADVVPHYHYAGSGAAGIVDVQTDLRKDAAAKKVSKVEEWAQRELNRSSGVWAGTSPPNSTLANEALLQSLRRDAMSSWPTRARTPEQFHGSSGGSNGPYDLVLYFTTMYDFDGVSVVPCQFDPLTGRPTVAHVNIEGLVLNHGWGYNDHVVKSGFTSRLVTQTFVLSRLVRALGGITAESHQRSPTELFNKSTAPSSAAPAASNTNGCDETKPTPPSRDSLLYSCASATSSTVDTCGNASIAPPMAIEATLRCETAAQTARQLPRTDVIRTYMRPEGLETRQLISPDFVEFVAGHFSWWQGASSEPSSDAPPPLNGSSQCPPLPIITEADTNGASSPDSDAHVLQQRADERRHVGGAIGGVDLEKYAFRLNPNIVDMTLSARVVYPSALAAGSFEIGLSAVALSALRSTGWYDAVDSTGFSSLRFDSFGRGAGPDFATRKCNDLPYTAGPPTQGTIGASLEYYGGPTPDAATSSRTTSDNDTIPFTIVSATADDVTVTLNSTNTSDQHSGTASSDQAASRGSEDTTTLRRLQAADVLKTSKYTSAAVWRPEFCFDVSTRSCTADRRAVASCFIRAYTFVLWGMRYFDNPSLGGGNSYLDYCPTLSHQETFCPDDDVGSFCFDAVSERSVRVVFREQSQQVASTEAFEELRGVEKQGGSNFGGAPSSPTKNERSPVKEEEARRVYEEGSAGSGDANETSVAVPYHSKVNGEAACFRVVDCDFDFETFTVVAIQSVNDTAPSPSAFSSTSSSSSGSDEPKQQPHVFKPYAVNSGLDPSLVPAAADSSGHTNYEETPFVKPNDQSSNPPQGPDAKASSSSSGDDVSQEWLRSSSVFLARCREIDRLHSGGVPSGTRPFATSSTSSTSAFFDVTYVFFANASDKSDGGMRRAVRTERTKRYACPPFATVCSAHRLQMYPGRRPDISHQSTFITGSAATSSGPNVPTSSTVPTSDLPFARAALSMNTALRSAALTCNVTSADNWTVPLLHPVANGSSAASGSGAGPETVPFSPLSHPSMIGHFPNRANTTLDGAEHVSIDSLRFVTATVAFVRSNMGNSSNGASSPSAASEDRRALSIEQGFLPFPDLSGVMPRYPSSAGDHPVHVDSWWDTEGVPVSLLSSGEARGGFDTSGSDAAAASTAPRTSNFGHSAEFTLFFSPSSNASCVFRSCAVQLFLESTGALSCPAFSAAAPNATNGSVRVFVRRVPGRRGPLLEPTDVPWIDAGAAADLLHRETSAGSVGMTVVLPTRSIASAEGETAFDWATLGTEDEVKLVLAGCSWSIALPPPMSGEQRWRAEEITAGPVLSRVALLSLSQ